MEQPTEKTAADINLEAATNIRLTRTASGLSQSDLGKLVGVSGTQIHKYETCQTRLNLGVVAKIAQHLGTTPAALLAPPADAAALAKIGVDRMTLDISRMLQGAPAENRRLAYEIVRLVLGFTLVAGDSEGALLDLPPGDGRGH